MLQKRCCITNTKQEQMSSHLSDDLIFPMDDIHELDMTQKGRHCHFKQPNYKYSSIQQLEKMFQKKDVFKKNNKTNVTKTNVTKTNVINNVPERILIGFVC